MNCDSQKSSQSLNAEWQRVHALPNQRVNHGASFADQLTRTQKLILDTQEYWSSNFGTVVQKLDLPSDPSRVPLTPVIFNLDPALSGVKVSGCTSRITSGPRFYFYYDLGFNVVDEGDALLIECDYNSNLFDGDTIRQWLGDFQTLLEGFVSDANEKLSQLPMLSEMERSQRPKPSLSAPRLALRSASKSVAQQYVAPGNKTEERLARMWCATLNLERVSSTANFFELGGQSLTAVSLFANIEKEFGKKLPLATLFTSPTIEALAVALQGENSKTEWSSLVPILHIPLDLSVQTVLRKNGLVKRRDLYAHLHYFTKDIALRTLDELGYDVLDYFYTPRSNELGSGLFNGFSGSRGKSALQSIRTSRSVFWVATASSCWPR